MSDADSPTPGQEPGGTGRRRAAPRPRSRPARPPRERSRATAGASAPGTSPASPADSRPTGLRMARLHLRMGSTSLARAELESFAGRGVLDEDALLDLAEVRWRTGDLAGAGEAAGTLLAMGREDALALAIAAEAISALGRPGEARRLAGRAVAAADGQSIEVMFAGMPRSLVWPENVGVDEAATDPTRARPAPRPRSIPPGRNARGGRVGWRTGLARGRRGARRRPRRARQRRHRSCRPPAGRRAPARAGFRRRGHRCRRGARNGSAACARRR